MKPTSPAHLDLKSLQMNKPTACLEIHKQAAAERNVNKATCKTQCNKAK